jgi:hypothetical protein
MQPADAAAQDAGQAELHGPKQTPYWELPKRPLNMFYWSTPAAPDAAQPQIGSDGAQPAVEALFTAAVPEPSPEGADGQVNAPVFPEPPKLPWMPGRSQQHGQQAEAQGLTVIRPKGSKPRYGT